MCAVGGGMYNVGHSALDTAKHGLPQHRKRMLIVGLRKLSPNHIAEFRWPRPVSCRPLANMLDPCH